MIEPQEIAFPDSNEFLLPQRAYLLGYSLQGAYARQQAIDDSRRHFDATDDADDVHQAQLALLGLAGDAMQAIEDVGNLAAALMEGLEGLPSYVKATVYRSTHVNNFFARLHKQEAGYFMALCGFEMEGLTMFDFFEFRPLLTDRERLAFKRAEEATAKLVGEHLIRLGADWERWRRVFHAYKHGALVANPEEVQIVDEDECPVPGMVIWPRKRREIEVGPHLKGPLSPVADQLQAEGELAVEMLEYLVELRLRSFDLIAFDELGNPSPSPQHPKVSPWRFWMRTVDIGEEDVELLRARGVDLDTVQIS